MFGENGQPARILAAFYADPEPISVRSKPQGVIVRSWGEIPAECVDDYGPYVSEMPDLDPPPKGSRGVWLWEGEAGGGEYNPHSGDANDIWWDGEWRKPGRLELVRLLEEPEPAVT
jgi:hypothetical protein